MDSILAVLKEFDRLENNPYFPDEAFVKKVLETYGYLSLVIFICPKMRGKYLNTDQKELFMPTEEPRDGLFFPRVLKLKSIVTRLWELGVPSKLTFIVGDNSYEVFKGPVLGIQLDKTIMDQRRQQYIANLTAQLVKVFPQMIEVLSLGLMGVETYKGALEIPKGLLETEAGYQKLSLQKYYDIADPKDEDILRIAELMLRAYAEEGFLVEAADGILIATEGDDQVETWVRRIEMGMLGGAKFPSIYPYIRKENSVQERR